MSRTKLTKEISRGGLSSSSTRREAPGKCSGRRTTWSGRGRFTTGLGRNTTGTRTCLRQSSDWETVTMKDETWGWPCLWSLTSSEYPTLSSCDDAIRCSTSSGTRKSKMESSKNATKLIFHQFENYCDKSTLHGLRYVGDTNLSIGER